MTEWVPALACAAADGFIDQRSVITISRKKTPSAHKPEVSAGRMAGAPSCALADLAGREGWRGRTCLLVISAHPDDVVLGCGRLMHAWSRTGRVIASTMTAGSGCVDGAMGRPGERSDRRLVEWRVAAAALGAETRLSRLLPAGVLHRYAATLTYLIEDQLDELGARCVVLAAPWQYDPHPDRGAVGRIAAQVARYRAVPLVEYPMWAAGRADPGAAGPAPAGLLRIDCGPEAEAAIDRARSAFVSQLSALGPELDPESAVAPPDFQHEQLVITAVQVN